MIMSIEFLKEELNKLSLDILEPLFNEILAIKKNELQERKKYYTNINSLYNILLEINQLSVQYKKTLSLFEILKCSDGECDFNSNELVDNLTVEQISKSSYLRRLARKRTSAIHYYTDDYRSELDKYYQKYGRKICGLQYINVIRNSLIAREIVDESVSGRDILNDIFYFYGVR